ncbi:MAG TPA: PPOX class F420-dependent oxidoreductase [Solirubrobacteraceae bacterium]|nr:PPOX class F420-dependent oxidoreductase [Solirubrobacteraceae bacterium]
MSALPESLLELVRSGPLAHLTTINADGSPQVTVIWIGLDGDQIISAHMRHNLKIRNIERDPRVALSFAAPHDRDQMRNPYAVLRATATAEPSDGAWDVLNRLAKVYMHPDSEFPQARRPGYIVRYEVQRISGIGPWAPS